MNRKVLIIIVILVILLLTGGGIYFIMQNNSQKETAEIQPQEEISDEQMKQTIVTLYYQNKETKELMPEGRMVDINKMISDPYITLLNLLMEGPKNENLQSTIPSEAKILKAELKGDILYIDFSNEFIANHLSGAEAESASVYSIANTMTELNEINGVKILVNGKENQEFKDKQLTLKDVFVRNENKSETSNKAQNIEA